LHKAYPVDKALFFQRKASYHGQEKLTLNSGED